MHALCVHIYINLYYVIWKYAEFIYIDSFIGWQMAAALHMYVCVRQEMA